MVIIEKLNISSQDTLDNILFFAKRKTSLHLYLLDINIYEYHLCTTYTILSVIHIPVVSFFST